ncbi:MAG: tRNA (adenosine(37)-N6)-threonylcarbamoyltransferase complex ATPase subunit type 1 TsaE [Clostridium sp.]|nr:tRNA (adenosine(37)-N6)-threonylcarbamoyltransferase complex ATPase subunit type 1 TsaE [Clostridium sp.]
MAYEVHAPAETFAFGKRMGVQAKAGQVFALAGDLGTGKTVFSQGFAEGLGIRDPVNSPTFTILQIYEGGRLELYHFDVYRIAEAEEMEEIGYEEYFYGQGVCLVEWGDRIETLLPDTAVKVVLEKDLEKGFSYRRITVIGADADRG